MILPCLVYEFDGKCELRIIFKMYCQIRFHGFVSCGGNHVLSAVGTCACLDYNFYL